MNYIITDHLRQRFVERKKENKKRYLHLRNCKSGCERCISLAYELRRKVKEDRSSIDAEIKEQMGKSKELNFIKNDEQFMNYLYERYGYDVDHKFHHYDDLIYVTIRCPEKGRIAVTCFDTKDSTFSKFLSRPKFGKKQFA